MERTRHPYDILIDAFTFKNLPYDLIACGLWLVGAIVSIYLPVLNESFLRIFFGVPLILFIPGYSLIAALFPSSKDIDGIERVALSFGLSIALVPLVGLALNYTPFGIRLDPIVTCLSILTIGLCIAAQYRRAQIPAEERFSVPFQEMKKALTDEFFPAEGSSRTDRILSIILLVAIVAAVATTIFVVVVPKEGEKFTEFFILGENQKAADYPSHLIAGSTASVFIGIGNHEYRAINYTVETYFMNMTFDETTNTSSLEHMDLVDRFIVPVTHNQTIIQPYSFSSQTPDANRIEFLLFNDTVPDESVQGMDRINQSYRDLHLWVTVRSLAE